MKGLLIKDYYTLLKQMKLYLFFIVVLSLFQSMSLSGLAVVYAAMLPITALAYDERSKWDNLAATMPYSSTNLVLSKYLLGYLSVMISCVLIFAVEFVASAYKQILFTPEQGITILLVGCVGVALLAVNLPFMFWLGVEKGRIIYFVLIAATVFLGMMAGEQIKNALSQVDLSIAGLSGAVAAATLLLNAASVWISINVYRKKRE